MVGSDVVLIRRTSRGKWDQPAARREALSAPPLELRHPCRRLSGALDGREMENAVRKSTFVLGALLALAASGTTAARSQEVGGTRPSDALSPAIAKLDIS